MIQLPKAQSLCGTTNEEIRFAATSPDSDENCSFGPVETEDIF